MEGDFDLCFLGGDSVLQNDKALCLFKFPRLYSLSDDEIKETPL